MFDDAIFDAVIFDTGGTPATTSPSAARSPRLVGSFYTPPARTLSGFVTLPALTITGSLLVIEDEEWLTGVPA